MQIGNQFRCYPTSAQEKVLLQWIGCQRNIYNSKVREDQYFRRFAHKSLNHAGQYAPIDQQYSQFKSELTPYLSEVPSVLLRNGAVLWKQAYGRYFSKLGGRPTIHHKHGKQSVWLTSELFKFVPVTETATGEITGYQLHVGIKKFPVGLLTLKAHKDFKLPASLHISIHAGRWHISFNYDDHIAEPTDKEITAHLLQFTETELQTMTAGLDRGVNMPLAVSDYQQFDFTQSQKQQLLKQERHKKSWQRRQARRTTGSSGWLKAKRKVARYQRYGTDVRRDVAHKTSCTLATDPRYQLFVFEALKVKNMTKKAKPKQDEQGRWMKNGAAAKSGLNKSILASTWGQTKVFLQYKARRQGKLVTEVAPQYSSQECAACGTIHQDNRKSQSEFVCLSCGNQDHADHNAAKVIKRRGVQQLLSGKSIQKEKKRCRITRIKVGAEGSELFAATQSTLSE
ncbi:transposase, partial [Methylotenera sp.]|uniref:RNA-guided endonuclease InsQ/TnpB family protein n=1 Tax=Methylotenera sp. TaxID=2051956 RepID=UPI002736B7CE